MKTINVIQAALFSLFILAAGAGCARFSGEAAGQMLPSSEGCSASPTVWQKEISGMLAADNGPLKSGLYIAEDENVLLNLWIGEDHRMILYFNDQVLAAAEPEETKGRLWLLSDAASGSVYEFKRLSSEALLFAGARGGGADGKGDRLPENVVLHLKK